MASAGSEGVPIPAQRAIRRRKSNVLQSSLDLVQSFSRSQQFRYGKLALGSAPSFAFTSRSPDADAEEGQGDASGYYGATGDGESYFDDGGEYDDQEDEEDGEREVERGYEDSHFTRRSSGFFYSDPVHDASAPTSPTNAHGHGHGHGNGPGHHHPQGINASSSTLSPSPAAPPPRVRRSFGPGLFNFTPTPSRLADQSASAITFDDSIVHDVDEEDEEEDNEHAEDTGRMLPPGLTNREARENTPLLGDASETPAARRRSSAATAMGRATHGAHRASAATAMSGHTYGAHEVRRFSESRRSILSGRSRRKSVSVVERGESTDGQTLFNAVAVLVGIGILSLPLALSYMGWIFGCTVLFGFGAVTCFTAKLLARLIAADPALTGYTDLGKRAFGPWAGGAITLLFCLELFSYGLALIVLFGDSMNVIFPSISSNTFKLVVFFFIVPTTLTPLKHLSLPSLLSTLSNFVLIAIILIDGLGKEAAPGSLRHPQPTSVAPQWHGANFLGGIGFVLAGFGGHAVIPSLARDMRHPEHFDRVINKAFAIATGLGFIAGAAGYLMIGNGVSDEITRDLMEERYGFPRWLNILATWMIVMNPLTKFGLCSRPFNHTLEAILGINRKPFKPDFDSADAAAHTQGSRHHLGRSPGRSPARSPGEHLTADISRISRLTRQSFSSIRSAGTGTGPVLGKLGAGRARGESVALSPTRSPTDEHGPAEGGGLGGWPSSVNGRDEHGYEDRDDDELEHGRDAAKTPLLAIPEGRESREAGLTQGPGQGQGQGQTSGSGDLASLPGHAAWRRAERLKLACRVVSRTCVTATCIAGAILIPGFERVMAFLGSFNAFLICVILPVTFYLSLAPGFGLVDYTSAAWKRQQVGLYVLLFVSAIMMTAGTTWAFKPKEAREV